MGFRKEEITPWLFIASYVANSLIAIILIVYSNSIETYSSSISAIIVSIIWIGYFAVSKRVWNTFTK